MADTFSYLSVLLYGTFAGALLVLQWHKPSKFVRRFALSWSIETVRNIIGLPEVRNLGGFISEWYGLHAALNFVAIWFLFSGCAALVGARLPRWLGPVYIGACIPLDIICRFIAPPYLARWLGWTAAEERSFMVAGTLAIQFVPLMATRAIILFWLCREWLSTRLPGALIAAFFCVPFTLFAFVVPLQVYFGYYPAWLSYFLLFRVFGFSIGIVMLLMGRQQRALEQSEQRLRAIIDHEPEGVIVLATDGLLSDMNPAGLRMIEADALDQLANQPMSALVVEEHRAAFHDFTGKILRGESGTLQFQVTGLKGSRRWLETHGTALRDPHGCATGLLGIMRDLTEPRLADEARRLSEARYRTLFERAPDGIVIVDSTSRCVDANLSICRMLGHTREELIGTNIPGTSVQPEILARGDAVNVAGSAAIQQTERQFRRKDGSVFGAEVIASLLPDGNTLEMIRDITERRRIHARFRRLVESNAQGVIFWNAEGKITGANDAFLLNVGRTREDLDEGRMSWVEMTPQKYAESDRRALAELAAKGSCAPFEKEFIRKDGSLAPVLVGAATFEDNPEEGVCFVIDLTERKKLEAQFLRAQRTEGIGTLAAGIAHDLNNMLSPILMAVESLRTLAKEDQDIGLIEILRENALRAAALVRQVLAFARGVEGESIIVNPLPLMRDLLKMVRDTFPKSIHVNFTTAPDLWTVTGDPTQIQQVFLNLLVNARDAMVDGGSLAITMANVMVDEAYAAMNPGARAAAYIVVKVEDSGIGIPPEIRERIFEPFFTTKEVGKGTGLGLSTTLAIVKSHGGFINVYSEIGKGSKFKIYLPANETDTVLTDIVEPAALPRGNGELVLVVDDEKAIREIARRILEQFGYRALLAAHGADAVALYVQHESEIAVVLTDMAMPVMDGPALITALTALNPKVRIVGSSGLETNGRVTKAIGVTLEHFVAKPYAAEALLGTLHRVLREEARA